MPDVLQIADLSHRYVERGKNVNVLDSVDLNIESSQMVAIQGASGSGKTTLLLICGAMLRPTRGAVTIDGTDLSTLPSWQWARFRATHIGYVFQTLQMIPYLDLLENISMVRGVSGETAADWLTRLGLEKRMHHKPQLLSHGERQRAALARAVAHRPSLLIADEPTGNLDEENTRLVFETLRQLASHDCAVVVASHNPLIRQFADKSFKIEFGKLIPT